MLDLESFTYLSRALESSISPIVILASNRGLTSIHNTPSSPADPSLLFAHGIPPDLLSRLLIVPTHPYTAPEITTIVSLRAKTEGLTLSDGALQRIAQKGADVSLRYALQLLAPASVLARVAGRTAGEVESADVEEAEGLFIDAGRSADVLRANGGKGFL